MVNSMSWLERIRKIDFTRVVWILISALLVYLVLTPVIYMFYEALTTETGKFTLDNFVKTFQRKRISQALINTIVVSVGVSVLGALIAVPLAFGVSRTNMRGKALVRSAVIVSIITPPFLVTMSYIILAGPNIGYLNVLLRKLFNLTTDYGPINVYTLFGLIVLAIPSSVAYVFLQTAPALENMDPSLEESARMVGANPLRTVLKVTLPLVKPAILSGMLLSFSAQVASYGVPHMLNINVLTIAIREALLMQLNFKSAAVLSVLVISMSLAVLAIYRYIIRSGKMYQTVSARGFRPSVMKLGRSRHIFTVLGVVYSLFAFLLPYGTLIAVSFLKTVGHGFRLSNFTLKNYVTAFSLQLPRVAFLNSTVLALSTATIVVVIAIVAGSIIVRTKLRGRAVLDYLSALPLGIAGTALAAGLIMMYLMPLSFLNIYGTLWILLIGYVTRFLPLGMRHCQTALLQVAPDLEEASRMTGANWLTTMRKITVPLVKNGVLYAWILVFVQSFSELSVSVLLRNVGTDVMSTAILDMWDGSARMPVATAMGAVVFLLITFLIVLAQKLTGRSLLESSN